MVDLIAVGYSLGLAASVLYLGAVGDRYGRKTLLLLGMGLTIPASILAAVAPSAIVLFGARVFGGVAAGMAYPTTLALITALWSGAARTRSIALWSALGGGSRRRTAGRRGAAGRLRLVVGVHHQRAVAAIALAFAWRLIPAHVNETTEPVDHLGGILSTPAGAGAGRSLTGSAPARAGLVLATLIGVAGVANLNLAVANVALPDIGKHFDAGQTMVDLIAVGYSLGLAASVLYLGAIGDRYGRKTLLVLGMALTIPASILAALAPTAQVLFLARVFGGVAAGMAYPTTLALITALWSGAARTKSIALWSALGGGMSALGPLLAGALLEGFDWWSVFIVSAPLAAIALFFAWRFVPAHVNETTERVDHLGGILSIALVGTLVLAINLAPEPGKGTTAVILGIVALAATGAFILRQRRVATPVVRPEDRRAADLLGRGARRDHRLRLADGGDVHRPAVRPERARLLDPAGGPGDPPGGDRDGDRRAAVGEAGRVARLALHPAGRLHLLPARLPGDADPLGRGRLLLPGRPRLPLHGDRRRLRRDAGLALADRLGAGEEGRHGLGDGGPAARPRRRDPAIGLRRPPHRRLREVLREQIAASPHAASVSEKVQNELTKSFSSAANTAQQYPEYAQAITAAARKSFLDGGDWTYAAGMIAVAIGICVVFFLFPKHETELALLERYHAEDA